MANFSGVVSGDEYNGSVNILNDSPSPSADHITPACPTPSNEGLQLGGY